MMLDTAKHENGLFSRQSKVLSAPEWGFMNYARILEQ